MKRHSLLFFLFTVLALLLLSCGGDVVDGGPLASDEDDTDTTTDTEDPAQDAADTDPEPADDADDASDDAADDDAAEDTDDSASDPEPTTDADEPRVSRVRLYFIAPGGGNEGRAEPFLVAVERELPFTPQIAHAALRALIEGPSGADQALVGDVSTAVPGETLLLGVTIDDRVATVDLSREFESGGGSFSMFSRLAQVVYTVTQFPTVDAVRFELDGQPVTVFSGEGIVLEAPVSRDDYLDLLPGVFVDTPPAGAEVSSPLRITGKAAVFEGTFQYRLEAADGTVLAEGFATTDNGVGWGAIDSTIRFDVDTRQDGTLTVWEYSARDGSIQSERTTPLTLLP
jgi:germination protein M